MTGFVIHNTDVVLKMTESVLKKPELDLNMTGLALNIVLRHNITRHNPIRYNITQHNHILTQPNEDTMSQNGNRQYGILFFKSL